MQKSFPLVILVITQSENHQEPTSTALESQNYTWQVKLGVRTRGGLKIRRGEVWIVMSCTPQRGEGSEGEVQLERGGPKKVGITRKRHSELMQLKLQVQFCTQI